ncbi:MAG TPA: SCO family protein [Terriglobales bacterium]|nr:SCO family protein [Terriglobales bacterium]
MSRSVRVSPPVPAFVFLATAISGWASAASAPVWQVDSKEPIAITQGEVTTRMPPLATPAPSDEVRTPKTASEALLSHFPNVVLKTQDNKPVRFYDDLIKGKVVMINFMFTSCDSLCPRATSNLAKVQNVLGKHLGRDIFMLSISLDPVTDTPKVLKKYARHFKIKRGWYFLTGERKDIDLIRRKLGAPPKSSSRYIGEHTEVLIIGNEATGTWIAIPSLTKPNNIAASVLGQMTSENVK